MDEFWKKNRDRLIYGGLALIFAFMFIGLGCLDLPVKEGGEVWIGSAQTIMIGLAMLCYNKARGNVDKPTNTNG